MCNIFDPISPLIQEDPDLIPGSLIPNYHSVVINDFVLDCVQGLGEIRLWNIDSMVHLSLEFNRCLQDANNWLGGQSNIPNTIRTKRDALGAWYEYQKTYINPDKFAHKTADDFSLACIQLNNAKSGLLEIITNDKLSEALSYPFWDSLVSLDEFEHCNTMRPYRNLLGKLEHVDGVWYGIGPRGFNTPVQLHSGSWL